MDDCYMFPGSSIKIKLVQTRDVASNKVISPVPGTKKQYIFKNPHSKQFPSSFSLTPSLPPFLLSLYSSLSVSFFILDLSVYFRLAWNFQTSCLCTAKCWDSKSPPTHLAFELVITKNEIHSSGDTVALLTQEMRFPPPFSPPFISPSPYTHACTLGFSVFYFVMLWNPLCPLARYLK